MTSSSSSSQSRYFLGTQAYPEYESWMREGFKHIKRAEEAYIEGTLQKKEGDRLGIYRIYPEDAEAIKETAAFWEGKDWRSQAEAALHATVPDYDLVDKMQEQLVFLRFMFDVPEGRVIADYQKIIDMGCNGLIDICRAHLEELGMPETGEAYEKYTYYLGTIMALEGVIAFANNYADEALRLAEECDDEERANELREIARICRKVPAEPSDTFQEAVQAWWFAHLCIFIELNGRGISPGRFDQYMYRPYLASKQAGTLTDEEALELMELLRVKCTEIGRLHPVFTESYLGGSIYQNLTLGGSDRYGMPADNELSRIVLKAGINVKTWQPTLSVRWRDDMSKEFKDAVVECIKAGSGYPALFNDKMGTERFMKDSGANLEDARDWAPCGCVDMQLCGKRMPMYSVPHTNNLKILELVMNDGVNPVTGDKLVNVSTPFPRELFRADRRILPSGCPRHRGRRGALLQHRDGRAQFARPRASVLSALLGRLPGQRQGRLLRRLPLQRPGLRHLLRHHQRRELPGRHQEVRLRRQEVHARRAQGGHGRELRGARGDAQGAARRAEVRQRRRLRRRDRGSNCTTSGLMPARGVTNWLGEKWQPSTLSVTTQVLLGKACGATPDGRLAQDTVGRRRAVGLPRHRRERPDRPHPLGLQGPRHEPAVHAVQHEVQPGRHRGAGGTPTSSSASTTPTSAWGGYQVQYNVVDRNMLVDAVENPQDYTDSWSAWAGFTARFIDLGPDVQQQIIDRTEFETA